MSKRAAHRKPGPLEPGGRSQRQLRVGEELRHRLALALERGLLRDPEVEGLSITVTEVKVSPDLTNATCYVVPLTRVNGSEDDMARVVKALNRAAGFLRHVVSEELGLRVSPRLSFAPDRSFEQASRVEAILKHPKVAQDLRAAEDTAEADDEEQDGPA